ncbi:hypothetical protein G7Y89_g9409 [Cudoniella acicularis]|uniref:Oxidase ustYa n=1 Tax=Cudoniella acicularis TaxID=354080 RepID=A0A8H4RFN9_9HELO|nr:hypothetical protein G7Y89_g9409 [Cudoniella acicularis]
MSDIDQSDSLEAALLPNEYEKRDNRPTDLSRVSRIRNAFFKTSAILWFLLTTLAALKILLQPLPSSLSKKTIQLEEDISLNVPEFPKTITQFQSVSGYTIDPLNTTAEEETAMVKLWSELMPAGRGFILPNGSVESLAPGIWETDRDEYNWAISTFHQLHCVYLLMEGYNKAVRNQPSMQKHISHCSEYLRKTIMCHADTTLEGRNPTAIERSGTISGDGANRVCKNYWDVFEWAQERRRSHFKMIG